jgi:ectoine hydroxylase-related dioxygenase (phytanoyl-CoA dioxygenase family)
MSQTHRHQGFAVVPSVLSRLEADELAACLEPQRRTRAGARHLMSLRAVSMLAADPRMIAIATTHLGVPAIPFRATLFDKAPGSNWLVAWHQDRALPLLERLEASGWGPWSLKGGVHYAHAPADALERVVALRLSLDDSGEDNGPLRVLPGTELRGVLTDAEIAALAREIAPVDCCVDAGGVVVMRPLIVHASSKAVSDRPRRVLHIEYAGSLDLRSRLRLAVV